MYRAPPAKLGSPYHLTSRRAQSGTYVVIRRAPGALLRAASLDFNLLPVETDGRVAKFTPHREW